MTLRPEPFSESRGDSPVRERYEVRRRYKRRRESAERLPTRLISKGLSPTVTAIQRAGLLAMDLASLDAMRQAAQSDPAIAVSTLRYAYEHYREHTCHLLDIGQICNLMGAHALHRAFGAVAGREPLEHNHDQAQAVCDHSVRVAALGVHLAKQFEGAEPPVVRLAALLHDVGKLLIIQASELDYADVPEEYNQPDRLNVYERRMLGYDHAKLGWHALSAWGLPEPLPTIVAWHHQGSRAYVIGGTIAHTVALIRCADMLDRLLSQHEEMDDEAMWKVDRNLACRRLGLPPEEVRRQWNELARIRRAAVLGESWFARLAAS